MTGTSFPQTAILEVARLDIQHGETTAFEAAFAETERIISTMPDYRWHQLQRCIKNDHRYLLLVSWERLENHTEGFRCSPENREWKRLLHHCHEPFPVVEHCRPT